MRMPGNCLAPQNYFWTGSPRLNCHSSSKAREQGQDPCKTNDSALLHGSLEPLLASRQGHQ